MRKIRDILRLRHEGGLSIRQIKASTKVSVGAIQNLLTQAQTLWLSWPLDPDLTILSWPVCFTRAQTRVSLAVSSCLTRPLMHQELKRKGMTLQLLWEEYTEQYPNRCCSTRSKNPFSSESTTSNGLSQGRNACMVRLESFALIRRKSSVSPIAEHWRVPQRIQKNAEYRATN